MTRLACLRGQVSDARERMTRHFRASQQFGDRDHVEAMRAATEFHHLVLAWQAEFRRRHS